MSEKEEIIITEEIKIPADAINYIIPDLRPLAVPIDKISIDPANARLHPEENIEAIKGSLLKYGQRKPIVVNISDNTIEAGNGTYLSALALGWKYIAAVFVEDDPTTAVGFSIADNRTAETSSWDFQTLFQLIRSVDKPEEIPGVTPEFLEAIREANEKPPSLEELEEEYGDNPNERDFWHPIDFKVPPDIYEEFLSLMALAPGEAEWEKFGKILQAVDVSALEWKDNE